MDALLLVLSLLAFGLGVLVVKGANGAIQEAEGGLLFVVAAVLFSGAAVVNAINRLRQALAPKPLQLTQKAPK